MKLYTFPPSPNARKVAAVIAQLNLDGVETHIVRLHKGEHLQPDFLAINPMGKIPALIDGDLAIGESNAICQYLAERAGDTSFYPADPKVRARIARWLFWESGSWAPVIGVYTSENVRKPMLGMGGPDPKQVAEAELRFRPLAAILDSHLAARDFLVGDVVTLADFAVGATATYVERGQIPFGDYPHLQAWWQRLNALESFKGTMPGGEIP